MINVRRLCFGKFANNANIALMALQIPVDNPNAVALAVDLLGRGTVIALPTDTVYGLACCATNVDAIKQLYEIKSRNENKPVAISLGKVSDIQHWVVVDHLPNGLLSSLLPGPVTLILKCAKKLDPSLNFSGKLGIRIPKNLFICEVANRLNCPIALTSANVSSEPSSIKIEEFKSLWSKLSGVFDGGILGVDSNRNASTVVDLSESGVYQIIRSGIAQTETRFIVESYGLKEI